MTSKIIITGILYLLMFVTGIILTKKGKPYSKVLSALHKLISLAAIVFMVLFVVQLEKISGISTGQWVLLVATGLFFIVAIGTGGFLAGHEEAPKPVTILHKFAPALVLILSTIVIYSLAF